GNPNADTVTIADNAASPTVTTTPAETGTPTPTPVAPTASPTPGSVTADHFTAYAVALTKGEPKIVPIGPLTLADRFRTAGYDVAKLGTLLVPADKNGEGVHDDVVHLIEYRLKARKGTAKFAKLSGFAIANQCNALVLQITKPLS